MVGRTREAAASLRRLVALRPDDADAHHALAVAMQALRAWPEAEAHYRAILQLDPTREVALQGLAETLRLRGEYGQAEDLFRHLLAARPNEAEPHNNLANVLHQQGRHQEAIRHYRQALAIRPDLVTAHVNLGDALRDERDAALMHQPADPDMHLALGALLLSVGRFEEGWPHFARRRHVAGYKQQSFAGAEWQGEPIGGRTLLLYSDEGFGDAIQCVRYVSLLRGARVVLGVQLELVRLFREVPGVSQVISTGDTMPPVDLHRPLLDLPGLLGTSLHAIQGAVPYLSVDAAAALRCHRRLEHLEGFRVGLAWSGNPAHPADHLRSVPLGRFASLFAAFPEACFISLQKGDALRQIDRLPDARLHDFDAALSDFYETAALISALDLVIAVDSAVVHLAGALGVPVWLLNRFNGCWRWVRGRDDSPWYPTLRQFRQPEPNDWDEVLARVEAALREELAKD